MKFHNASDIPAHCAAYEQSIAEAGGIDAQVLGIGNAAAGTNDSPIPIINTRPDRFRPQ